MWYKAFCTYFWFVSWDDISFGLSLDIRAPHIDIHIPFGWVRLGWEERCTNKPLNWKDNLWRKKTLIDLDKESGDAS